MFEVTIFSHNYSSDILLDEPFATERRTFCVHWCFQITCQSARLFVKGAALEKVCIYVGVWVHNCASRSQEKWKFLERTVRQQKVCISLSQICWAPRACNRSIWQAACPGSVQMTEMKCWTPTNISGRISSSPKDCQEAPQKVQETPVWPIQACCWELEKAKGYWLMC